MSCGAEAPTLVRAISAVFSCVENETGSHGARYNETENGPRI